MRKPILIAVIFLITTSLAFSHGGGLDASGGHWDRKAGTYHYHRAPAPAPVTTYSTTTTTIQPTYAPTTTIVYVTKTGEKYHYSWCTYLSQSKIEIQLGAAVARAYQPCKICRPPLLAIQEVIPKQ